VAIAKLDPHRYTHFKMQHPDALAICLALTSNGKYQSYKTWRHAVRVTLAQVFERATAGLACWDMVNEITSYL
jgi:hypothetical protein